MNPSNNGHDPKKNAKQADDPTENGKTNETPDHNPGPSETRDGPHRTDSTGNERRSLALRPGDEFCAVLLRHDLNEGESRVRGKIYDADDDVRDRLINFDTLDGPGEEILKDLSRGDYVAIINERDGDHWTAEAIRQPERDYS